MALPDFFHESEAMAKGLKVCGIDEAGRGPWAGPVVAAAVILDPGRIPPGLNDSKKLSEEKRELLFPAIVAAAQVGVGIASAEEIDTLNILRATFLAMERAARELPLVPQLALVDGNKAPPLSMKVTTIIGGDGKCLSIAAASIIAKVTRDRMMRNYDDAHPGYGFARHKGYGTAAHTEALKRLGPCPVHRKSFAPVRAVLDEQQH